MAGGDELGPDAVGIVEQLAELEPVVADDAGIRRAGRRYSSDEIIDDPAELVRRFRRVKRNIEPIGHAAGIGGVAGAAAALLVIGPRRDGSATAAGPSHESAEAVEVAAEPLRPSRHAA